MDVIAQRGFAALMAAACTVSAAGAVAQPSTFTRNPVWTPALAVLPLWCWAWLFAVAAAAGALVATGWVGGWWVVHTSTSAFTWLGVAASAATSVVRGNTVSMVGLVVTVLPSVMTVWAVWAVDRWRRMDAAVSVD